jgi:REP element-mobilizing transposase RayT
MRMVRLFPPETVWLITNRCEREQFLLKPSAEVNEAVGGWFARSLERYGDGIEVYAFNVLSNHFHILARDTKGQLPKVMWYFQTNLAKEVKRLRGSATGHVFGRRYDAKLVESEQRFLSRYAYVLCNPVKDGLVEEAGQWPGLSSLDAALSGEPLRFRLLDRTAYHNASRGGRRVRREDFVRTHTIELAVPPMWAGLGRRRRRSVIRELVSGYDAVKELERESEGRGVAGVARVLSRSFADRPRRPAFRRRRLVVAESAEREEEVMEGWRRAHDSYRETFAGLRRALLLGRRFHGEWPPWTCPPGSLVPMGYGGG